MGRFLNADTLVGETGELLSHNMFAYCNNNPVNNEDQDGDVAWWVGAAVGGALFEAASYALSHRNGGFSWKGLGKAAAKGAVKGVLTAGVGKALKLVKVANAATKPAKATKVITKSTKILKPAKNAKIIRKASPKVAVKGSSKGFSKVTQKVNIQKVSDKLLKKNKIDAHKLKYDILTKSAPISRYDIYIDKITKQLFIYGKGGKGVGIPTGYYIK